MRRAVVQAVRVARRKPFHKSITHTFGFTSSVARHINTRSTTATLCRDAAPLIIQSSMYIRNFSVAAFVSVLASGYWYYQNGQTPGAVFLGNKTSDALTYQNKLTGSSLDSNSPTSQATLTAPLAGVVNEKQVSAVNSDFFESELSADSNLSKRTEEQDYHMDTLTPEQATEKLRRSEESYLVGRGKGVVRYDLVQVASNSPIEDDHAEKLVSVDQTISPSEDGSTNDWMFWGVFDGHSGWTTSAKLRQVLISYVARELQGVYKSAVIDSKSPFPSPEAIDAAMKRGFLALDHEIVNGSVEKTRSKGFKSASTELLAPALSGSCALLSFYDSKSRLFRVACTGDSRAVLGRKGGSGKWKAIPLSEDQTGGTPSEMARLRAEHPGEEYVVHRGRILGGLEPSRAFGDASYKWTRETQEWAKRFFFGRTPNTLLKTPPYVTAEPIVTTTKIEPEGGDFVVLATDGLWEMLTNEEVVGLVGRWIEEQKKGSSGGTWAGSLFRSSSKDLPVVKPEHQASKDKNDNKDKEGQRAPIRQVQYDIKSTDERFVVEDKNVATHLVRNALGGRDRDLVCALLSLISPNSRRYRYMFCSLTSRSVR